jgi:hypothetical protein
MDLKTLTLGLALAASLPAARAQLNDTEYLPGDLLVMLKPGMEAGTVARDLAVVDGQATGISVVEEVSAPMRAWLLHFDPQQQTQWRMLRAAWAHPAVQLAQNNHVVKERAVPNDTQYGQQWHHANINSAAAWDTSTGGVTASGDTIVVAIIENADLSHPDLMANAWINRAEVAGNGIDDDGNGYVDDVRGWNTPSANDNVYSGSHGTQCAGMAGATGNNNLGVTGANWNVKLMPVNYGGTAEAQVVAAYTYPLVMRRRYNATGGQQGAFVVVTSASWGIDGGQPANSPLWCAMYDTLGRAGILNCGATANNAVNVDQVGDLPTACPSDYMISVTATNSSDQRTFSAWGATTIDVGAPGENVRTTSIGGGYGSTSGTSFACPLTAGVIALLYSAPCGSLMALVHADPEQGALFVRQKLFEGVDQVGNLPGNTVTGGRINAGTSMNLIMAGCGSCPTPFGGTASRQGSTITYGWAATGSGPFTVRYRPVGAADWTIADATNGTSVAIDGFNPCAAYEFQVEAQCGDESSGFSPSTIAAAPNEAAPVIASSGYRTFCAGSGFSLTSSVASGITWSSGEQLPTISPQQSGSYTVTFNGQCGTYTSAPVEVTVLSSAAPVSSDVQLAAPGSATLIASGGNIKWYDAAAGGVVVGTGSPWETPVLNATRSYWCTSTVTNDTASVYGGKANYASANGVYQTNANNYLLFTATEPFTIRSVKVYASGAGSRTIALVNGAGTVIAQGTYDLPDGESRVTLNFTVGAAGNYGLRAGAGTNPQLWRDGSGSNPAYPYALGSYGSITGSTAAGSNALAYYYFFYDWQVSAPIVACESPRTQVTVEVPSGVGEQVAGPLRVFPVPADRDAFFDLAGEAARGACTITILDATGRVVASKQTENGRATVTTAFLANGLYTYRIAQQGSTLATGRLLVEHLW